jgi:hypothetical protein
MWLGAKFDIKTEMLQNGTLEGDGRQYPELGLGYSATASS